MDKEQTIVSFLRRCQNGSSEALNIAKYIGFRSAKDVLPLLRRMECEGTITRTGYLWQVSRGGSPGTGDAEVFLPVPAANQLPVLTDTPGRSRSAGQLGSIAMNDVRQATPRYSSLPEGHSRRRSDETVSDHFNYTCLCVKSEQNIHNTVYDCVCVSHVHYACSCDKIIGADSAGATGNFSPVLMKEPGKTPRFLPR